MNFNKAKNIKPSTSGLLGEPQGFGGWLILVIIHFLFALGSLFTGLYENLSGLADTQALNTLMTKGHPNYSPYWKTVITSQIVIEILVLIFTVITMIAFFRRKKSAIKLMIVFYILLVAYPIVSLQIGNIIPLIAENQMTNVYSNIFSAFIASLIWISYFIKSKRVKNTFIY